PTGVQLAKMAARVPSGFQFIIKAHRSLTHERDQTQLQKFRECLEPLLRTGQLRDVLCQFPQRFHYTQANRAWLATVRKHLAGISTAVEFRHESWDQPAITDWLC